MSRRWIWIGNWCGSRKCVDKPNTSGCFEHTWHSVPVTISYDGTDVLFFRSWWCQHYTDNRSGQHKHYTHPHFRAR